MQLLGLQAQGLLGAPSPISGAVPTLDMPWKLQGGLYSSISIFPGLRVPWLGMVACGPS